MGNEAKKKPAGSIRMVILAIVVLDALAIIFLLLQLALKAFSVVSVALYFIASILACILPRLNKVDTLRGRTKSVCIAHVVTVVLFVAAATLLAVVGYETDEYGEIMIPEKVPAASIATVVLIVLSGIGVLVSLYLARSLLFLAVKHKTLISSRGVKDRSFPSTFSDDAPRDNDFLKDDKWEMTYGRRIALGLMGRGWYYPREKVGEDIDGVHMDFDSGQGDDNDGNGDGDFKDDESDNLQRPLQMRNLRRRSKFSLSVNVLTHFPDLANAWAFFEHVTLPRFRVQDREEDKKRLNKAEPGERNFKTRLYSPILTPLSQMGDFGLGVGLFFWTQSTLALTLAIASLLNIPNMLYFEGPDYSGGQRGVMLLLKGSAVCTIQPWVPCPSCSLDDFERDPGRLANGINAEGESLVFARQNQCGRPPFAQGMINNGTLLLVIVALLLMRFYQHRQQTAFDENEQTAQDYSVVIHNPPEDAKDPDEWKRFFEDGFGNGVHVTCCTVGIDNDLLVRSLVERREKVMRLQMALPPGTDMAPRNLARIAGSVERGRNTLQELLAKVAPGVPEYYGRLLVLNSMILGLVQQRYHASSVFVTFETEGAQRRVLEKLSVGTLAVKRNRTKGIEHRHLFRGETVLDVREAEEPGTVRWQDLSVSTWKKIRQILVTTTVALGLLFLSALAVKESRDYRIDVGDVHLGVSFLVAILNQIFPMVALPLTGLEYHVSESHTQASLFFKIALFRWVNTAIVLTIITPFTQTVSDGPGHLLPGVAGIFFADIVTSNALQLLDPVGNFKRHVLAPRAKTQEAMNVLMQGQVYYLAERYTNVSKILFLALWYCPIYPGALFLGALALFISYFTDKFSIMRTWKPAEKLGTLISNLSNKYFFSLTIGVMAVISSYYWTGFPFDNVCADEETGAYQGMWNVSALDGTTMSETVLVNSTATIRYCDQDLLRLNGDVTFPALPSWQREGEEWMTEDQEKLTTIYGWTSVGVLVGVGLVFMKAMFVSIKALFRQSFKTIGEIQGINFSDVPSISAYVPEVKINMMTFPLVAADTDSFDEELFEWSDPVRPHSYYDLTRDAVQLLSDDGLTASEIDNVFSKVRHWHPKDSSDLEDSSGGSVKSRTGE